MLTLSIYGVAFELDLPAEVATPFMAEFPVEWLSETPKARPAWAARVESKQGHYLLRIGETPWRQAKEVAPLVDALQRLARSSVAERDKTHGYVWGGAVRWQERVWAITGYPRRGTTTLLNAMARAGGEILSDGIIVVTSQGRVLPFPRSAPRSVQPDFFLFVSHRAEGRFQLDTMNAGGTASLILSRAVPNPRFFPAFAALARHARGFYVLRDEAEPAIEHLRGLT